MLKAFHDRLRDLCAYDVEGHGLRGTRALEWQTQRTRSLADEFGILKVADFSWADWRESDPDVKYGSEHIFEFFPEDGHVRKTTIPGRFGLMPYVALRPKIALHEAVHPFGNRKSLETRPGTPLEYLGRWLGANAVFNDAVELASVVEWADGRVSFVITQPQYDGEPASEADIISYFETSGWKWIADPTTDGHLLFFNYAWGLLAFDAIRRNCFLHDASLMPFDVIVCRPDEELTDFLCLYR